MLSWQEGRASLSNNELALHARSAMRLAVVGVVSRFIESHGEGIIFLAHLVHHGDGLLVDAFWDAILVEHNIVGTALVVDPAKSSQVARRRIKGVELVLRL